MEKFELHILGCGSALPTTRHFATSQVVNVRDKLYMIDCGEGSQLQFRKSRLKFSRLNHIFISHLHGDHVYGLFGLISTMGLMGRRTPLPIYAPKPLDEILANHLKYFDTTLPYEVQWHEVHTRHHELLYENKTLEVWSIPLRHRVPAAGCLFREKSPPLNLHKEAIERYELGIAQRVAAKRGEDILLDDGRLIPNSELTYLPYKERSYAYLSDTLYSAKAVKLVHGVDLLYHEATFADIDKAMARETGHSTAIQAGKAAQTAEARKLLIGHFSSRYKDEQLLVNEARTIFPNTEAVIEGNSYDIPIDKTV